MRASLLPLIATIFTFQFATASVAAAEKKATAKKRAATEETEREDSATNEIKVVKPKPSNRQNVNEDDGFTSDRKYRIGNEELEVDPD
jgi:hypothetical protein